MQATWEINTSPLLVQLRARNVRLAAETTPPVVPLVVPSNDEQSAKVREAYARGRMDGERAVNEQLLRQRQEIRELQEKVLEPLRRAISDVVRDTEQSLVALAIQVAERLVSGLPISAEVVQAAMDEALTQIKEDSECHIYLHPEDLKLLQTSMAETPNGEKKPNVSTALHFHASSEVERGGCVVKTRFGTVDGQRRTKIEQLKKNLLS